MTAAVAIWNTDTLAQATGGTWLRRPGEVSILAPGREPAQRLSISTDSRTIEAGQVFLALAGERFDGHRFLEQAAQRGASALIAHDHAAAVCAMESDPQVGVLLVEDTLAALTDLARAHRKMLNRTMVIGITGSNGKTTTKRLLEAALATKLRGSANLKSFNNHIGVPLTILSAQPDDDYLIVEIGTNSPGEVETLSRLAGPHIGVITGIGQSHLLGLGTLDGVLTEKLALFRELPSGAVAIYNADAPLLHRAVLDDPSFRSLKLRSYGLATEDADLRAWSVLPTAQGTSFVIDGQEARLGLIGEHNVLSAMAALAVAEALGVERESALKAMTGVLPSDMRLQFQQIGEMTILNDAYNANPDSMRAALETFSRITTDDRRRALILGEMLELGAETEGAHAQLAREIAGMERAGLRIDLIVLLGELMQITAAVLAEEGSGAAVLPFPDGLTDAALPQIRAMIARDDQILIKGSRLLGLERIVDVLTRETGMKVATD